MRISTLFLAAAMATAMSGGAIAAGSGGGGSMGAMPSESSPRYDPAEEYAKAIKALQAKNYKAAARSAQRVTNAVPKSIDGWKLLGMAQSGAENWKGARRAYEKAVRLAPDDLAVRAGYGLALAKLKDAKAQEQLDWLNAQAAACSGDCSVVNSLKADVESAMGVEGASKPSAALERGALIFAAAGDRAYLDAVGLINERRFDDALAALDTARAAFGPHPDVLTYQGYVWRQKGQLDRAELYYLQALAIAPDHRGATEYYGELKVERGDLAGAQALLVRLERICAYGCAEAEELRRWIDAGERPAL